MEKVLGLFDPDQLRGRRIVQERQIREHLECSIRCEPREHWCRKRSILEAQEQATVRKNFRFDPLDSRYPAAQDLEYLFQPFGVLVMKVLDHVREVVTGLRKPFLAPCLGVSTRRVG